MKHLLLLLLLILSATLFAQPVRFTVNESSIIKDSAGNVYAYKFWKALVMQGDFEIRPMDNLNVNTDFLLVRLTEEEKLSVLRKCRNPRRVSISKPVKSSVVLKQEISRTE